MKKTIVIISTIIVATGIIWGYRALQGGKEPSYEFALAERSDLVHKVSVTGRVKPSEIVELGFEQGGKVAKVLVEVGDQVTNGQQLITLTNAELQAQLAQANAGVASENATLQQLQASLEREQVKLEELRRGTRVEEIQIAQTKLINAQKALDDANAQLEDVKQQGATDLANLYDDVRDILNDAYTKADDAINKQIGELFSNASSDSPNLTFATDPQSEINVESGRLVMTNTLKTFKEEVDALSLNYDDLDASLKSGENYLIDVRDFLVELNDAINAAVGLSLTTANTYRSGVNTARTNVNTALSSLANQMQLIAAQKVENQNDTTIAQTKVNDAGQALDVAKDELALKQAGTTPEEIQAQVVKIREADLAILAQRAKLTQARANVQHIQAQIDKTVLIAPIDGIVTEQEVKVGEIVSANTPIVSLISEAVFEVETHVPEVDIAKIQLANPATITLDAYGNDIIFDARVVSIDPAETIIEGVSTYKVTLQFTRDDNRIKSGMTANTDILTDKREEVIVIPQRAILRKNGTNFVRVIVNGVIQEVEVITGLRGSDGTIEVIEGVNEGDKVITFLET